MMRPLRFGIVGVGNIAPVHAAAIAGTPDAVLVAVATRNPERGGAFAAERGATWYADYRAMLERETLDIVTICTPPDLHAPITVAAAAAGVHVLCEKALARNVAECDTMIAACDEAGVALGVCFEYRFEPLTLKLREGLEAGRLGKIVWNATSTLWYRSDAYYGSGAWRGTWAGEGGGVLINQAVHAIDLLLWLGGDPVRVTAKTGTLNHAIEVEDSAMALLEYADGRMGMIQATTAAYPGLPEHLEFFGTQGTAVYQKGTGRLEWYFANPESKHVDEAGISSGAARPMDITAAGHTALFRDFAAAVRDGRRPALDGREGRRSVALIEAIYRSAREGKTVDLGAGPA